jgi:quercetin dioxygenase-like cupin family protein
MPYNRLEDMEQTEPVPGYRLRAVHSDHMTVAYWEIEPGAVMPEHSHPHEQVATLLEGEFEFTLGGESRTLRPGTVVVVPSRVPHSGRARTLCRIIDAFHPSRDEWR